MKRESMENVKHFQKSAEKEILTFLQEMDLDKLKQAAELILNAQANGGRLHITGIGKPGHVAEYMASLFSSTGNPCYFLHGTEAVHGSCGQLAEGDVVICISNSGETEELKATAAAIRNNACKLIAVTGGLHSWLGTYCDVSLFAGVKEEGGPLNRAPRNSILAEIIVLQALSVALQSEKDWDPVRYVRCHPGGSLGKLRQEEGGSAVC